MTRLATWPLRTDHLAGGTLVSIATSWHGSEDAAAPVRTRRSNGPMRMRGCFWKDEMVADSGTRIADPGILVSQTGALSECPLCRRAHTRGSKTRRACLAGRIRCFPNRKSCWGGRKACLIARIRCTDRLDVMCGAADALYDRPDVMFSGPETMLGRPFALYGWSGSYVGRVGNLVGSRTAPVDLRSDRVHVERFVGAAVFRMKPLGDRTKCRPVRG